MPLGFVVVWTWKKKDDIKACLAVDCFVSFHADHLRKQHPKGFQGLKMFFFNWLKQHWHPKPQLERNSNMNHSQRLVKEAAPKLAFTVQGKDICLTVPRLPIDPSLRSVPEVQRMVPSPMSGSRMQDVPVCPLSPLCGCRFIPFSGCRKFKH